MSVDLTVSEKTPQTPVADTLDGDAVSKYLNLNPEFFVVYEDLLPRLRIPHSNGKAVSLIEKQVDVLRGQCSRLENRLTDLIAVARQNEALHTRLHELIQDIISAATLDDIVNLTRSSLLKNFNADHVRIFLNSTVIGASAAVDSAVAHKSADLRESVSELQVDMGMDLALDLELDSGVTPLDETVAEIALEDAEVPDVDTAMLMCDTDMGLFKTLFESRQTVCGMPDANQLTALGCTNADGLGSAALVPLWHESALGLVLISSSDQTRFASGKGVMFLNQLGDLLSRRLHSLSEAHHHSQKEDSVPPIAASGEQSASISESASAP